MFPILFHIGPLTVYSYGLMLAVAVIVCTMLLTQDAARVGIKKDVVVDLVFWCIVGGILGARVFYVILNWGYFLESPQEIIMLQKGGLAFQGGLIAGILSALIFIRRHKLNLPAVADLCAPYLALGHAIGRLGCFLNGCCYGTAVSWGIYFPVHQEHLHPTQLYESFGLLILFFILKFVQSHPHKPGQVFAKYLLYAPILRFFVEFFRDDHSLYGGMSIYQYVCLVLIIIGFYVNLQINRQPRRQ